MAPGAITSWAVSKKPDLSMMLNGILAGETTASGELLTGDGIVLIGGGDGYSSRYPLIDIDELRFWSRALSQNDIAARMSAPLSGTEPDLTTYFNFDHGLMPVELGRASCRESV